MLRKKVKGTWIRYSMGEVGDTVIVAVSGGADSVCLLDVLCELEDELGVELAIAHFNHKLRGEASDRDKSFVKKLAKEKGLPFFAGSGNVLKKAHREGLSIEMAARVLRYEFFEKLAKKLTPYSSGKVKVALGHNANDQAETVLMRLLRGAGPRGLAGIPPVRGMFIRPLIEISREEIIKYLKTQNLEWVEDKTNLSDDYLRNKIRLKLLPQLKKEFNPNLVNTLVRTANACRDMIEFVDEETMQTPLSFKRTKDAITFPRALIADKPPALAVAVLEQALNAFGSGLWAVRSDHRRAILDALRSGKETKITLPNSIEVRLDSSMIRIGKPHRTDSPVFCYPLKVRGITEIPEASAYIEAMVIEKSTPLPSEWELKRSPHIAHLDYDVLQRPLEVRNFRAGDRFQPFGMKEEKKLQDFFVDLKVPREERMLVPIVTANQKIAWVAHYRIAHPYRITDATRRILKLIFHRS